MTTNTRPCLLRLQILQQFPLEELKILAGELGMDWNELPGRARRKKCQALLDRIETTRKFPLLAALLQAERPGVTWQDLAVSEPQGNDRITARDRQLIREYEQIITEAILNPQIIEPGPDPTIPSLVHEKTRLVLDELTGAAKAEIIHFLNQCGLLKQQNTISLEGCNLSHANLSRMNLSGFDLKHANINSANLEGAILVRVELSHASLVNAHLARAMLVEANLFSANLCGADLSQANLTNASLLQANITGAQIKEAILHGVFLNKANLEGMDLTGVDFKDANLSYVILRDANLRGANFEGANLREADLSQADLTGARFTEANLYGAKLNRSILVGGVFDRAILDFADLTGTTIALDQIHQVSLKHGLAIPDGRWYRDWSPKYTQPLLLIIEGDPDIADMFHAYFGVHGYEAYTVNWGEDVARFCANHIPDLILLDTRLPDIDGYEVAQRLRSTRPTRNIPIIFLTENSVGADRMLPYGIGADDYYRKPFDLQELNLRMRSTLRRSLGTASQVNLTTGLPEIEQVEKRLMDCLGREKWEISLLSIQNLDNFREKYGYIAADDVIRSASLMIINTIKTMGQPDDFVGHMGRAVFMVIASASEADSFGERIAAKLDQALKYFYPVKDRAGILIGKRLAVKLCKIEAWEETFESLQDMMNRFTNETLCSELKPWLSVTPVQPAPIPGR